MLGRKLIPTRVYPLSELKGQEVMKAVSLRKNGRSSNHVFHFPKDVIIVSDCFIKVCMVQSENRTLWLLYEFLSLVLMGKSQLTEAQIRLFCCSTAPQVMHNDKALHVFLLNIFSLLKTMRYQSLWVIFQPSWPYFLILLVCMPLPSPESRCSPVCSQSSMHNILSIGNVHLQLVYSAIFMI